jgi:hypothetical protein
MLDRELIGRLIEWTESEASRLGGAFRLIRLVPWRCGELIADGIPHAGTFRDCFAARFTGTADVPELLLSYLATRHGLEWYRALVSERIGGSVLTKTIVVETTAVLRGRFADLLGAPADLLEMTWDHYLQTGEFHRSESEGEYSTRVRAETVRIGGLPVLHSCGPLGEMGLILTTMPASEAAAERIFSHVRNLFGQRGHAMASDLLEARVVAKLNGSRAPDSPPVLSPKIPSEQEPPVPLVPRLGQRPAGPGLPDRARE